MPLGLLGDGEAGEILGWRAGAAPLEHRLTEGRVEDMGLRSGKWVQVLSNRGRAVLVKVGGSRIAVDRALAMRIAVRRGGT